MERYLDASLSPIERAKDLLSKMSIEEKMAQTNCVLVPRGKEDLAKAFCTYGMGEISTLEVRNLKTTEEACAYQRQIQQMIMENSPHHIPAIFHMEGLCGAFIQGAVSFPSGISRASSFDAALEEKIGSVVARQENATGFTHTLAPVLDISRDSRMGRQGETYGEDPTLASALGSAYANGLQKSAVRCPNYFDGNPVAGEGLRYSEAVAKHFMGFHNSEGGIHGADSHTPPRLMEEIYGKPFQAAITEANLRGVMPCYCTFDGEPASTSRYLLTDILRERMGFDGLAVSDYGGVSNAHTVQKVYENETEAGLYAMAAGMDIEMPIPVSYNKTLAQWFKDGRADVNILDTVVLRILEAKFRMGLFEHPFALEGEAHKAAFFDKNDRETSLQSARESMVLLKNNGALPLKKNVKKIALVGCHADNAGSFFGGYTHVSMREAVHAAANSIAGIGDAASNQQKQISYVPGTQIQSSEAEEFKEVLRQIKPECRSLLEELKARLPETEIIYAYGYPIAGNDTSHHAKALAAIASADICLMTLGGKYGSCSIASMGEGVDGTDINLPECQDIFIREAAKLGKPLVGIHLDGRPISSDIADECLDAIVEAWSPSEMGAPAIVDVLTGAVNPSGKLPLCVPYHAGQIPVYYNHVNGSSWHQGASIGFANYVDMPHTPRYFFGYGLSYTTFEYSDFKVEQCIVDANETFTAAVTVKNTGMMAGTEVVQLYLKDVFASMARPVMELAGFARVPLMPGEKKQIVFTLHPSQIAFITRDMRWKIEKGDVEVMVGSSSDKIAFTETIKVSNDAFIDGTKRWFYAKAAIRS